MTRTGTHPTPRAFDDFYRELQPRLLASLVAFSGDADLATDAVDEAFVRALVHWNRVTAMASPSGWLYRVAINVARRQARRHVHEREIAVRLATDRIHAVPTGHGADLGIELREVIARLPDRQRLAVVLRYVADLPEADIARAMGIRRSTVSATARQGPGQSPARPSPPRRPRRACSPGRPWRKIGIADGSRISRIWVFDQRLINCP
jgi:RNA polymerase sigma factor (sigma-70 family)